MPPSEKGFYPVFQTLEYLDTDDTDIIDPKAEDVYTRRLSYRVEFMPSRTSAALPTAG